MSEQFTPQLSDFLRDNPTINFIRYQWIDYTGILRARVVTTSHCRDLVLRSAPLPMSPVAMTSTAINEFMPDLIPTGVDLLYPDFTSLRPCLYAPGYASVMCFVSEGIGNVGFKRCPRTILRALLTRRRELEIKVGFEVEFKCLNIDGTDLEDCLKGWSTTTGLRNRCLPIIEEVVQILQQSGIEVQQFHTEGSKGMFEISTGPMLAMEATDALVYTREAIKTLFANRNIIATWHPSPQPKHSGVGAHVHLSILPATDGVSNDFLGGILSRLPALCAFSLPLDESYKRINDFMSEAGAYVAWGTENRDVPLRKIKTGHWEVRCCDGAANMYLVLATFIASGIQGIETGNGDLAWKDCLTCPSLLDEQRRALLGINKKLPTGLLESLTALEEFEWSKFGLADAATTYAKIKKHELTSLKKLNDDERRALLVRLF
jgi:glutamine synthetase